MSSFNVTVTEDTNSGSAYADIQVRGQYAHQPLSLRAFVGGATFNNNSLDARDAAAVIEGLRSFLGAYDRVTPRKP